MLLTYIKSEIQKLMISKAYPPTKMEYPLIIVWDSKHEMRISKPKVHIDILLSQSRDSLGYYWIIISLSNLVNKNEKPEKKTA